MSKVKERDLGRFITNPECASHEEFKKYGQREFEKSHQPNDFSHIRKSNPDAGHPRGIT